MGAPAVGASGSHPLGDCPSCGCAARRRWLRHPELVLWLCQDCGLGYSDPQPRDIVDRRYLTQYDLAEHFGGFEARKGAMNARRLDRLPAPSHGQRLLDVGCGDGQFAAAAASRGWDSHGVELNPPAARRARERRVRVIESRLEDADLASSTFDLVTAWDVIEHVPEPKPFVDMLARLVAPGGTLAITTLNRLSLVSRVFGRRWSMVAVDHFTYWDEHSLRRAFAAGPLRVVDSSSYGLGRDFVTWIDRLHGRREQLAGIEPACRRPAAPQGAGWDTRSSVLAAEHALNRALDVTSLGVGVEIVLRAPQG